jgi:hypothetical protein
LFVVGAAKSGTTALYHYFKVHPQVFVPKVKEPNYMAFYAGNVPAAGPGDRHTVDNSVTNFDDYVQLYAGRTTELIAADISIDSKPQQGTTLHVIWRSKSSI